MAANVGQLSTDELKEIIGSVVEEKLKEALGDPDSGLDIRADVKDQLLRQQDEVRNGERGEDLAGGMTVRNISPCCQPASR